MFPTRISSSAPAANSDCRISCCGRPPIANWFLCRVLAGIRPGRARGRDRRISPARTPFRRPGRADRIVSLRMLLTRVLSALGARTGRRCSGHFGGWLFIAFLDSLLRRSLWEWIDDRAKQALFDLAARALDRRGFSLCRFAGVGPPDSCCAVMAVWLCRDCVLFAIVWTTDIAGYFAGRRSAAETCRLAISPNKTWSGAIAGLAGSLFVSRSARNLFRKVGSCRSWRCDPAVDCLADRRPCRIGVQALLRR